MNVNEFREGWKYKLSFGIPPKYARFICKRYKRGLVLRCTNGCKPSFVYIKNLDNYCLDVIEED
jgi:hypothetical protein